jgi:hypothetical protein
MPAPPDPNLDYSPAASLRVLNEAKYVLGLFQC